MVENDNYLRLQWYCTLEGKTPRLLFNTYDADASPSFCARRFIETLPQLKRYRDGEYLLRVIVADTVTLTNYLVRLRVIKQTTIKVYVLNTVFSVK